MFLVKIIVWFRGLKSRIGKRWEDFWCFCSMVEDGDGYMINGRCNGVCESRFSKVVCDDCKSCKYCIEFEKEKENAKTC